MHKFPFLIAGLDVAELPAVNASLNALATLLLVIGYTMIRRGRPRAHKAAMLAAFAVSVLFLTCYVVYHTAAGHVAFGGPSPVRELYLVLLLTHVVTAAAVPLLAAVTIYLGLRDRRAAHRRLAQWTFPIWLYVSVTGVVIYVMLYHLYPSASRPPTMRASDAVVECLVTRSKT